MTHEGTIEAAGTTFHYRATGSGRLALLLHGFGMDSRVWDLVLQRVGPGRQCVAVDLRGAGRNPLGADLTLPLERHADDVAALVTAFGARSVDLVGFSMGGFVLLEVLQRHPAVVSTAAFIGTRGTAEDDATRATRDALIRTLLERGRSAAYSELLPRLVAADAPNYVLARLRTMLEDQSYEGLVAAQQAMRERSDRLKAVRAARKPLLVIVGEHDAFAPPPLAKAVADASADAQLEVIAGVGHTTPLESAGRIARLLTDFWRRTGPDLQ